MFQQCYEPKVVTSAAQNCEYSPRPVLGVELLARGRGFSQKAKLEKIVLAELRKMEKFRRGIYRKEYNELGRYVD